METILFFFLGASLGSFLGLLVDRFPQQSIFFPQSHCHSCGKTLQVRDLVPILSQLIHRSRCRFCQVKFPMVYAVLEAACGIVFLLWWAETITFVQLLLLLMSVTLSLYDLKNQDYPLLVWLAFTLLLLSFTGITTLALILFLLGIMAELFDLKIGSGDFFYLASLALAVNLQNILWIVQIGSWLGILHILMTQKKKKTIPFLPFLSLAYVIVSFF